MKLIVRKLKGHKTYKNEYYKMRKQAEQRVKDREGKEVQIALDVVIDDYGVSPKADWSKFRNNMVPAPPPKRKPKTINYLEDL